MKFSGLATILAFATACSAGCKPGLWGTGTCGKVQVDLAHQNPVTTPHIIDELRTCFKNHYGPGPYRFNGLDVPDYSRTGNMWMVQKKINGHWFSMSAGNLCGCKQSVDANIFNDLHGKAQTGRFTTLVQRCAVNNRNFCPSAGVPGGGLSPSGVYGAADWCGGVKCPTGGAKKSAICG